MNNILYKKPLYFFSLILFFISMNSVLNYPFYFIFGIFHGVNYIYSSRSRQRPNKFLLIYVLILWFIAYIEKIISLYIYGKQDFFIDLSILFFIGLMGFMCIGPILRK